MQNDLNSSMKASKNEIIAKLQKENSDLKESILNLKDELDDQNNLITDMERDIVEMQQYIRRNNI